MPKLSTKPIDLVLAGGGVKGIGLVGAVVKLMEAGYRGYLSIEYEAKEDPLTALPRHVRAIREAMRET